MILGISVNITIDGGYISIGMMWFLDAFCIGRMLFDVIITNITNEVM